VGGNAVTPTCAAASSSTVCLVDTTTYTNGRSVTIGSISNAGSLTYTTAATSGGAPASAGSTLTVPGSNVQTNIVSANNSYPYPGTASKAPTRSDCAGTTCTYAEEMTNFANWWAYYQTRLRAMKTSVSLAFKNITDGYRVGFTTISSTGVTNGTKFLGNDTYTGTQRNSFLTKIFQTATANATPLRGSLSKVGRYYANRFTGETDPVQYSCQQNFAILSTDGYWNTNDETSTYKNLDLTGSTIGDMDSDAGSRPIYEGPTASSGSLADVAKYYYDTDLRTGTSGSAYCSSNAISPDYSTGGNPDVCTNNVFTSDSDGQTQQHMTTFTLGLGADGLLNYTPDYKDAQSGDFYDLKNGYGNPTVNWPDPINNSGPERIDDLWHAAVNGHGTYFSARNPSQIINGIKGALAGIQVKLGSAAAAATSTLNPVAGNNYAYVASYTTKKWKGNLEARSINTTTGVVNETASWCAENIPAATCTSPDTFVTDNTGSSPIYYCVVHNSTAANCTGGTFDAVSGDCTTQIANSCPGTMPGRVGTTTDTRTIYTAPAGSLTPLTGQNLVPFDAAYATANPANFSAGHISGLSQWTGLSAAQQSMAAGTNLINYLRGQTGYEDRITNANKLYRAREATLGDALESQPFFISKPVFSYPYPGYSTYKSNNNTRAGSVYMGTNDGMLHAFGASDGTERWAYVPSMVIPNMWKLASTAYETNHANFVNGSPIISDVCTASCTDPANAVWKTILVAGLNAGGRGYFALDITDPATPALLWEFTPASDSDLGYSYGHPIITRKADGTWVVLITSGYDNGTDSAVPATPATNPATFLPNSPAGSGIGYLYVLNAGTGGIISKISTGVGSAAAPSGLGQISAWNDEPGGNRTGPVYGGDLQGNIWRFDINSPATATIGTGAVMQFATLYSDTAGSRPQPVTTSPILGTVATKRVVFVGTGKYLESSDLRDSQKQSLYAITDDNATTTLVNPRTHTTAPKMVQQTITMSGSIRAGSMNPVNIPTDRGWYIDFPDGGTTDIGSERMNIDGRLVQGTLIIPTIVPSATVCQPGGSGWLNYFNYENGWPVRDSTTKGSTNVNVSVKYEAPIVGVNIVYINGNPVVEVVTANDPTPSVDTNPMFKGSMKGFLARRGTWRELR
jgi:type IV pilus assembly protein PilY1